MVELFENQSKTQTRQSSKGNQLKWNDGQFWYKADYTGYEGLSEYVISHLLQKTSLKEQEFVRYETEDIRYKSQIFKGCKSADFLKNDWQIITLERLFQTFTGESLCKCIYRIKDNSERLEFMVEQTKRITGLSDFGEYMSKVLTIDSFFLNEDRHTHNIAVLMNGSGGYAYCPIFDNGAGLLADTTMDYPLSGNLHEMIESARSKTFCSDFDEQLEIAEQLYGQQIKFYFTKQDVMEIMQKTDYDVQIKERVETIVMDRMRRYQYLL